MFAYVNGFLEDATVDNAVIDVNGFGINVRISADTASRLPGIGEEVRLYTYTYVKEDAFLLYGDRKNTRLNSSHPSRSRMPSSA